MKKLLFICLFLFTGTKGFNQALSDYAFSAFSSTYSSVSGSYISSSGGTGWGVSIYDDCWYNGIPIGFNFVYCGNTYTSVSASQNCWIVLGQTFGGSVYNTYDCDLSNTTSGGFGAFNLPRPILAALWVDVIVTANNVRYATTGTTPNRVFTIEFSNCGLYTSTTPAESVEIKLYETTNIIDFAYTNISTYSSSTGHLAIGITDGTGAYPVTGTANFWSLNGTGSSPTPSMITESKFLTGLPATNQVYRWSPQCTGTPAAGTISASTSTGCAPYSSTLTLTGSSTALGVTYQWQSAPTSTGTWTNISGATSLTYTTTVSTSLWYRCVVTCTNSGISSNTAAIQLVLNSPPASISGPTSVCAGSTITLTDATTGGTWTSSSTGIATVGSSSGVVTGVSPGTSIISYTLPTGCSATMMVTVVTAPSVISGPSTVCTGNTITLTNSLGGGTWTSSATGTATVGATTGIVTGVAVGVVTISYTVGACMATKTITVNLSPAAISGPTAVCVGATIALTDATTGGTWTSSNPFVGSVGSASGIVTGVAGGTVTISYTLPGGCYALYPVTVNPSPGGIAGIPIVCVGQTTLLVAIGSGTWTSSNPLIASVGSTTGIVTGVSAGVATISYFLSTGCYSTTNVTVNPIPAAITGDPNLCIGSNDTLSCTTSGGLWSTSNPFIADVNPGTGVDLGVAVGTAIISYSLPTGCASTLIVTVHPSPSAIAGTMSVCVGASTLLFSSAGGTWSSTPISVATIGSTTGLVNGVSPGTAVIRYTAATGCYVTAVVTVRPNPASITGPPTLCVGQTAAFTCATLGVTWSSSSVGIATIGSSTGIATGISPGVVTITCSTSFSCTSTFTLSVNTSPSSIIGSSQVCLGASTPFTNPVGGGVWSSSNPLIASVGSGSGVVNGIATGVATITYSIGASCYATKNITVNPLPAPISGPGTVCVGTTITLTDPGGGTWLSGSTAIATIGSLTGIVTGIIPGASVITYTLPTGCSITRTITVNPLPPAITGLNTVCQNSTITLSDPIPGGTWGSSPTTIATVGSSTGIVTGVAPGVATISYTISTGCTITKSITVNPLPGLCNVTGGGSICAGDPGLHVGLSCSSIGISYQLYNGTTAVGAPVIGTGGVLDFGLQSAAGVYTVVATNPITNCSRPMSGSATITVNPLPASISGPSAVCVGATITLTDATVGGVWTSSTTTVATVGVSSGVVSGIATGTTVITYTIPSTGCKVTMVVTVSPTPTAIIGGPTACTFNTITLTDAVPGGVWTSGNIGVATIGSLSGILTGVTAGTTLVTYSLGSGCTVTKTITVNPSPATIVGSSAICVGATTTYTDATPAIIWSSMSTAIATIGSTSGIATGISPGTVTIICFWPLTGCSTTKSITVNPLPTAITGTLKVCVNGTTTLADGIPGGTWSSGSPGIATVGSLTGIVTGVTAGTATITYSLGTGCITTAVVTVNPLPAAITGTAQVCIGLTTALADATPGGTWSTTTPATGTVSATGVVTGITAGPDTIFYTLPLTGCAAMREVTVNPLPAPISGIANVCVGQTSLLVDAVGGGSWSSSAPLTATVSSSGLVTGVSAGLAIITYSAGGCWVVTTATVIASPAAIIGPATVCIGNNITMSDATIGGVWSSSSPLQATIGSASGIVTGIASGTVIISYTLGSTGCTAITPVVVNPIGPILGPNTVCMLQTAVYTDTALTGIWSTSNPLIATISSSGLVTGISTGIVTITYALSTGCYAVKAITIDPIPAVIVGTPYVCAGQTTLLTDATIGGTWSSSNPSVGNVSSTGLVTGLSGGTTIISYAVGAGCPRTLTVTVGSIPPAISGPSDICLGTTVLYTDLATGGTWSSSNPVVGSISSTGFVTGLSLGSTTIGYSLGTGCVVTKTVTVAPLPPAIGGVPQVCVSSTTTLSNSAPGGTWSSSSTGIATVNPLSGVVTGITPGTATIIYTLATGCSRTIVVTVNGLPAAISGSPNVCAGATTALSDAVTGGTWSSSDITVATVLATGPGSSTVTGIAAGSAIISYTLGTGCATSMVIFVNPAPAPISGSPNICIGNTTLLSDATPGGTWSSSNPSIAPVGASTGIVTGTTLGTAIITYTSSTSCTATMAVSVNPMPGTIIGASNVCAGSAIILSNTVPGGTWSSSDITIATATTTGATTGSVTGVSAGSVTITYSLGAGCSVTKNIMVYPTPTPISGPNTVCATQMISLFDATIGGTWSSTAPAIATIGATTGDVTGVSAGTALISYTNSLGCAATHPVTVHQMPSPISGSSNVCLGGTTVLTDSITGGTWYSTIPSVATIGSTSGIVSGLSLGTTTIFYQLTGGCYVSKVINVYPLPIVFTVTGGGSHCAADTGVHIGLTGSTVGINYMLYRGATAVGAFAGTGAPMDFGLLTVAGTYTVIGTSTATTCSIPMAGAAVIGIIPSVTPVVNLNVTPNDTVCVGATATFTPIISNGGTAPVFNWSVNGLPVAVSSTYAFIPANGDVVSVTMTSNATCPVPATATRTVTMTVQPFGTPDIFVALTPNDTVCKGTLVIANAVTMYAGNAPAYTWFKNGAIVSYSGSSYSFVANDGDEIFAILTSNYPCRLSNMDSSARVVETVEDPVLPVVTISAVPGTLINKGENDTLTAIVVDAVDPTYQWYINGLPVAGATNATFINAVYSYPQQDSVSCAVTSHAICEVTTHQWLYIRVTTEGVGNINTGSGITVLPNPNKGQFIIKGSLNTFTDEEVTLEITNMLGQVVYHETITAKGGNLDKEVILGNTIANGMYLLNLRFGTVSSIFHIVVEK